MGTLGKHWKLSEETRKRQSLARKGMKYPNRIISNETRLKLSLVKKGKKHWWRKNQPGPMLGKHHSIETRQKISKSKKGKPQSFIHKTNRIKSLPRGEKHWAWKTDRSTLVNYCDRDLPVYSLWRTKVFKRDKYRCRMFNQDCKGQLEVHHILRFSEYPELRFNENNGITLCKFHHPRKKEDEHRLSPYFQEIIKNKIKC